MSYVNFSVLKGKVLKKIHGGSGDGLIRFVTTENEVYEQYHDHECCESVYIESIVGDLNDLIGSPILVANENSDSNSPPPESCGMGSFEGYESYTWTFYTLATIKGYVDIRWVGSSNGYYSESVSFRKL